MKEPTDKQVKAEIENLKELKPKIQQYSMFGDDNHKHLDAQVQVLQKRMTEEQVYEKFEDSDNPDSTSDIVSNARDAAMWLIGEEEAPSKGWQSLVK